MDSIKQEINKIQIPTGLHERSVLGVEKARKEKAGNRKSWIKKPLISAVLAAALIVPPSAFAYQTYLADELYGSFQQVKKHFLGATMEGYLLFDAKLSQAQGEMDNKEFNRFKELIKILIAAKVDYGDSNGNIDYSQVPEQRLTELKMVLFEVQPYFDRLNGQRSSMDVLSPEEYEEYIESLMVYEEIMVKSGIQSPQQLDQIPAHMQDDFIQARDIIWEVDERVSK
ncbi:DUF3600 domain-containing protein [Rossellomorea aquimaris]|uniref:DUF3600 domain-containing protein n=1 Tax=Rossellomorea aquimaris TaxID=189382 RepID=UPI001CD1CC1C|nr:DUF3600 domain-containing protein [Rossellomorea aquimaris]MCA1054411.1 DUF3600 domain-containing protein [Rossellomorea aquimaris]